MLYARSHIQDSTSHDVLIYQSLDTGWDRKNQSENEFTDVVWSCDASIAGKCSTDWDNRSHVISKHIRVKQKGDPFSGERERERNVLFNDALNTFYLRLYGVRHMVKDHFDNEKGNPLPTQATLID